MQVLDSLFCCHIHCLYLYFLTEVEAVPLVLATEDVAELVAGDDGAADHSLIVDMRMSVNPVVDGGGRNIVSEVYGKCLCKRAFTDDL